MTSEKPPFDREQVLELRIKSRRGTPLEGWEQSHLEVMWREYPKEYAELENDVMNAAAASIGSTRRWK